MSFLLNLIPGAAGLRNVCIGLLVLSLAVCGSGLYGHHKGVMQERAKQEAKATKIALERETEARVASENFRRTEADLRARVDTAEGKYAALQTQHVAALAAARRDSDRLRDQLANYAGSSLPADAACAADREHARTLGQLLSESVQLQEALAGDAEVNADAVRALLEAWPK